MLLIRNKELRSVIKIAVPFIVIPAITIIGALAFDEKKHIIISLAVAVFSLMLFAAGFEKKSTGTRRMVIVAVITEGRIQLRRSIRKLPRRSILPPRTPHHRSHHHLLRLHRELQPRPRKLRQFQLRHR